MKGVILAVIVIFLIACTPQEKIEPKTVPKEVGNMKLTSDAFENKGDIPSDYTCDASDISPQLSIEDVPENAKSFALIMDDPDAPMGTFVHWVVWNIPTDTREIPKSTEPNGIQGKTDFGKQGYGGPCPPSGTHRYFFKLYALDTELDLPEGSTKEDLEAAMQGHILEETQLMGNYKRS